ncbi:hypothetical protein [Actibacterium sp. D379-3]
MFRKYIAMLMLISIVAVVSSGLMTLIVERPSFTMQMHPVHKLFGILLSITSVLHIYLNRRPLWAHLKTRRVTIGASVMTVVLIGLYGVAFMNPVDAELAKRMDDAAAEAEAR